MKLCRIERAVSWFFQLTAAAILFQTLFFKFTGAEESKYIFSTLGVEPWGRYATGVLELVAVALLLWERHSAFGAALAVGLMVGAIGSHLTRLGIEVKGDGGFLFALAISALGAAAIVLWLRRGQVGETLRALRRGRSAAGDTALHRSCKA